MSISKLCDYFEDIGLINLNSINLFLELYTQLQKNNKAIFPNYLMRAKYALYNYIKHISNNKDLLLGYCNETIEKYSSWNIMKHYFCLSKMLVIFRYKEKQKIMQSFYKIKYRIKNMKNKGSSHSIKENPNIIIKDESISQDHKLLYSSLKNFKPMSKNLNHSRNKKMNNTNYGHMNNNNNYNNYTSANLLSHSNNGSVSISLKRNPNHLRSTSNPESKNNIESYQSKSNCTYQSQSQSLESFYSAQLRYKDNHQGKILSLKLNNLKKIEAECTFQPQTNHSKTHSRTFDSPSYTMPRYIKLNHDAIEHKEKLTQLIIKQHKEEMNQRSIAPKSYNEYCHTMNDLPSDQYYHKLYQDAQEYQQKKRLKQKNYYAEMMHHPRYINNNIPITTTFEERNQKSIEKKKKRINVSNSSNNRTHKERNKGLALNENSKRVVERLYERHVDRSKGKKETLKMPTQSKDLNYLKTIPTPKAKNEAKQKNAKDIKSSSKLNHNNIENKSDNQEINTNELNERNDISNNSSQLLNKIKSEHVINYKTDNKIISNQLESSSKALAINPTLMEEKISFHTGADYNILLTNNNNSHSNENNTINTPSITNIETMNYTSKALQFLLSKNPPDSQY